MQIPIVTKWFEERRRRQFWDEVYAQDEREQAQRLTQLDAEHRANFGHGLPTDYFFDESCPQCEYIEAGHTLPFHYWSLYCPACPKPVEEVVDEVENDGPPDCDEYCGQLSCSTCGDEARENLREQELIFAQ